MTFNPENHGFRKLDFTYAPGELAVYEYQVDGIDQSTHDFLRMAAYLTKDGSFVTIWNGLLDPFGAEHLIGIREHPELDSFNFKEQYDEQLFRGYIEDDETAALILKAVRIERFRPQILRRTEDGKFGCFLLAEGDPVGKDGESLPSPS
jgi:hypothetical protein